MEASLQEKEIRLTELTAERETLKQLKQSIDTEGREATRDQTETRNKIDQAVAYQTNIRQNERNKYAKFGNGIGEYLSSLTRYAF